MSMVNIPVQTIIDPRKIRGTSSAVIIDAVDEYNSQLITCLESKAIRYIHVRNDNVAQVGNFQVSLKSINAASQPAIPGTILPLAGGSPNSAYKVFSGLGASTWGRIQLTTDYTPAINEKLFCMVEPSGFQAGDKFKHTFSTPVLTDMLSYLASSTGGTPATANNTSAFAFESTDGTFLKVVSDSPCFTSAINFNNTSTPDEIGNLISFPYTHRVIGLYSILDLDFATDLVLYYNTNPFYSLDANIRNATTIQGLYIWVTPTIVPANTNYRVAIKPTTANNIQVYQTVFITSYEAASKSAFYNGVTINKTSRSDAGAWTDDATIMVNILPIIDQIDIPRNNFRGSNIK